MFSSSSSSRAETFYSAVISQVKPTVDGRGNGAFAATPIERGTIIGDYEGELLSEAEYWQRYPSGVVRLVMLHHTRTT